MAITCKSVKFTILPQTRMQEEMVTSLNAFFKKKGSLDKKAKKNEAKKPKLQFDNNIFEIVDAKGAIVSCRREQKARVDESLALLQEHLSKLKFELLKNKYNILFELVDSSNYTELLENIIEPLEKNYNNIQTKLEKLGEFRENVMKKIANKKDELILNKSTLKAQLTEASREEKAFLMKQYVENEQHLLDYNVFLDDDIYLFLETDRLDIVSVNNSSYLDSLVSNSEKGVNQEDFIKEKKTKKNADQKKIQEEKEEIDNNENDDFDEAIDNEVENQPENTRENDITDETKKNALLGAIELQE
jgi:hypothetical protein